MTRKLDYIEIEKNLIDGIKKFVGDKKVLVGISGGADSALTTTLCVKALGKEKVLGLLIPYGEQIDIDDCKKLVEKLGINYKEMNIKPIVDRYVDLLDCSKKRLVRANIMARTRMTILYAMANEINGLVAGTTNKSEFEVGYGTKYGDLACDFEVIEELYKTEVFLMLKKIAIDDKLPILEKIANKKPTAGLWQGQTDEKEFGFRYKVLDKFLQGEKVDEKVETKIKNLIKISEHKRHLPPVIKINKPGMQALIIGRFQPLCNHHVEMLKEVVQKFLIKKLFIGIGDSQKIDKRNFLKSDEVEEMLMPILNNLGVDCEVRIVPDINNPPKYCEHVESIFPEINENNTQLFTENDYTKDCFVNYGHNYLVVCPTIIDNKATNIRNLILKSDSGWKNFVPLEVIEFLEKSDFISRMK